MRTHPRCLRTFPIVILFMAGCGASTGDAGTGVRATRDSLPGGGVRVHYSDLPTVTDTVMYDLRIGEVEGDPNMVFGDIRGVEADSAGNIYVLDHQASEIRVFGPGGAHLRTLAGSGEGPGELTAANGMAFDRHGTLWVQDHGQWRMIGLSTDGDEVGRHPMHVRAYGYVWNGAVDDRGRFWKPASHTDTRRTFPPEEGLHEASVRRYLKWYDPASEETDSIFMGESHARSYVSRNDRGGYTWRSIPFGARGAMVIDPAGGMWATTGDAYSIVRIDGSGDTLLVIEVDVTAEPVSDSDREAYVESIVETQPDARAAAEAAVALAPDRKPIIDQLLLDDEGRLWVRRASDDGEPIRYDLFDRDGEFLGAVALGFPASEYLPPRVRNGKLYAMMLDEMDVPSVVRADLPALP